MHADYEDIRSLIAAEPKWWDENGVPRYCDFHPKAAADIYAREVCLLLIECQNCRREFRVAMSWSLGNRVYDDPPPSELIPEDQLYYGDPPNIGCCPAGPTMSSVPKVVLEFWSRRHKQPYLAPDWQRVPELERKIDCGWDEDEPVFDTTGPLDAPEETPN